MTKKQIKNFRDLLVYQDSYDAMLLVIREIIPQLPYCERYDLKQQLSRSSKAIPRLIAEGYAKRHQKAGFQKYLYDALAESNETIVSLEQCKDIYKVNPELVKKLITIYDITSRRIYNLGKAWNNFKLSKPINH